MAQVNKWVNSGTEAGDRTQAAQAAGGEVREIAFSFAVAAGDDDGSVFKIAQLPAGAILTEILLNNDVITLGTDYDLGFYDPDDNTVEVDKDVLADGLNMANGAALGSEKNGLAAFDLNKIGQRVWELLGKTIDNKKEGYVLALTGNTVGTAAGDISGHIRYIQG